MQDKCKNRFILPTFFAFFLITSFPCTVPLYTSIPLLLLLQSTYKTRDPLQFNNNPSATYTPRFFLSHKNPLICQQNPVHRTSKSIYITLWCPTPWHTMCRREQLTFNLKSEILQGCEFIKGESSSTSRKERILVLFLVGIRGVRWKVSSSESRGRWTGWNVESHDSRRWCL